MTTKGQTRKAKPPIASVLAGFHDRADLLRDDLRRDLLPRYDPGDDVGLEIARLSDGLAASIDLMRKIVDDSESLANCLKIERIIRTGYEPPGND